MNLRVYVRNYMYGVLLGILHGVYVYGVCLLWCLGCAEDAVSVMHVKYAKYAMYKMCVRVCNVQITYMSCMTA